MDFERTVKEEFEKLNLPKKPSIFIQNVVSKNTYLIEISIGDRMDIDQLGSIIFSYDYKNDKFYFSWIKTKNS